MVEVIQVVSEGLHLSGTFWSWMNGLDFENLGFGVAAVFVLTWLFSMGYKHRGYEKLSFAETGRSN